MEVLTILILTSLRFLLLIAAWSSLCLGLLLHDQHTLALLVLTGFLKQFLALFKFVSHNGVLGLYEFLRLFSAISSLFWIVGLVHLLH